MSRTRRLRGEILTFLSEVGEANTTAILDHVNRRFVKVGFDEGTDLGGFRMRVCVWSMAAA